jgi:drug/metabolite transporter (DMT)-like permease
MTWWYGIAAASLFFSSVWAFSAKFLTTNRQVFISQVVLIPVMYLMNAWYSKSVVLATNQKVPLFIVQMLNVSLSAIITFVLGMLLLKQHPSSLQIIGGIVVVVVVVLLNVK